MPFSIRRAEPADAAHLVELGRAVGSEQGAWLIAASDWRSVGEERRYLRALRRHPNAAAYVAELANGTVAGRLSLSRDTYPASAHVADLGLMVAAAHRRRGVGRALLDQATGWAREAGVAKLELHVFPWNEPALALYEGAGFVREGYRRRHYRREGQEVDAILMALFVDEQQR